MNDQTDFFSSIRTIRSSMQSQGYDMNELVQAAQYRWLKPTEVLFILQNHVNNQLTEIPPQKPPSGSLFLFNKRVLRFFRKDGHMWRKKKDGRTVGEAHERLKVGNVETLNCYYAHGEVNSNFQRRSYWMLDPAHEHIVLVHYRDITEGILKASPNSQGSPGLSYTSIQNSSFSTGQHPGSSSSLSEVNESYHSSFSPGSSEVSSDLINRSNGVAQLNGNGRVGHVSCSPEADVTVTLRRLEEQLSLNDDDFPDLSPYYEENTDVGVQNIGPSHQEDFAALESVRSSTGPVGSRAYSTSNSLLHISGDNRKQHLPHVGSEYTIEGNESPFWKETLELCSNSTWMNLQDTSTDSSKGKAFAPESSDFSAYLTELPDEWTTQWVDFSSTNTNIKEHNAGLEKSFSQHLSEAEQFLLGSDEPIVSSTHLSRPQAGQTSEVFPHSAGLKASDVNSSHWFGQESQATIPPKAEFILPLAQKQKFSIQEISPESGYATENTKVIITGNFICDPSESAWACMFGAIEVPVQIIQEGVLRCQAPPNIPGKVTLCITSGNQEACSEVREFEYCVKPSSCSNCGLSGKEPTKNTDELLLLVRFAQMLLFETSIEKNKSESGNDIQSPWEHIIEDLLLGTVTPSRVTEWILEELLKDKLQQWLSSKCQHGETLCSSLTKKEQGVIHMVAGLGFEWALKPLLDTGVSINFRDINGWTPLHWAARFGREKMVAALVASGASAVAVTDPTAQDPAGKTAGLIAASSGHKGLAGYLSEIALTSRLSSLTLDKSELPEGSALIEAERAVGRISDERFGSVEDQVSLKDYLAAARNATQAAARIQSAFRAHSFRTRQQKESAIPYFDDNGINQNEIPGLSAASKLTFRNLRDHNKAALSIQKNYRSYKGHKEFLALRQKVVRIQAHVRGYQVRKKYKVLWAVGVLDKIILRWRRRGAGLRGFRPDSESIEESDDEDILKVFRKEKVDVAIQEAVSQVLNIIESRDACQQYQRMLQSYRQAKAELSRMAVEKGLITEVSADMEAADDDDELYMLP